MFMPVEWLRRNVLSRFDKRKATTETKAETAPTNWRDKAVEKLSPKDRENWDRLKVSFERRGKNQQWYYAAAGADILPVLLAPKDAKHHFVDPQYNESVDGEDEEYKKWYTTPFTNLGIASELQQLSKTEGRSDDILQISDGTTIRRVGDDAEKPETLPEERIDVVYNNSVSWSHGPAPADSLDHLKQTGLLVYVARPGSDYRAIDLTEVGKNLEQFGFARKANVPFEKLDIPAIAETSNIARGQKANVHVFEKTRELLPEELDFLKINQALMDIKGWIRTVMNSSFKRSEAHIVDKSFITREFTKGMRALAEAMSKAAYVPKGIADFQLKSLFQDEEASIIEKIRANYVLTGNHYDGFSDSLITLPAEYDELRTICLNELERVGLSL